MQVSVRSRLSDALGSLHHWGLDDEIASWGYKVPDCDHVFEKVRVAPSEACGSLWKPVEACGSMGRLAHLLG